MISQVGILPKNGGRLPRLLQFIRAAPKNASFAIITDVAKREHEEKVWYDLDGMKRLKSFVAEETFTVTMPGAVPCPKTVSRERSEEEKHGCINYLLIVKK